MKSGKTRAGRIEPTRTPVAPAHGAASRTYRLLLATAMDVIRDGHVPSIAEVAVRAGVARATAYRYFPSRSVLVTAVVDHSLTPVRQWKSEVHDGRLRVKEMFSATFPSFKRFEPQLRAAVQLSLEQWALERAGLLEEEPYRRGHRVGIIAHALEPFDGVLPAPTLERLRKALSLIYGIEPHIVLKDIWGSNDREVEQVVLWMADAIVAAALGEAPATGRPLNGARPKRTARVVPERGAGSAGPRERPLGGQRTK